MTNLVGCLSTNYLIAGRKQLVAHDSQQIVVWKQLVVHDSEQIVVWKQLVAHDSGQIVVCQTTTNYRSHTGCENL